jgi:hypothetical protein
MVQSPASYQSPQSRTEYVNAPPVGCVGMTWLAAGHNPYFRALFRAHLGVAPAGSLERCPKKFGIASFNLVLLS